MEAGLHFPGSCAQEEVPLEALTEAREPREGRTGLHGEEGKRKGMEEVSWPLWSGSLWRASELLGLGEGCKGGFISVALLLLVWKWDSRM